jgi:hypothetical protein
VQGVLGILLRLKLMDEFSGKMIRGKLKERFSFNGVLHSRNYGSEAS